MDKIIQIADKYNLKIIEDAAHAAEAYFKGFKVGSIGDITCFSFYVTKNIVTGEGGMVTTNNKKLADKIRIRSLHGISKDAWKRFSEEGYSHYETIYPGFKYNMIDIQASLGIHQLNRVNETLVLRESHWKQYNEAFHNIPQIITPSEDDRIIHARHLYTIILRINQLKIDRNQFISELKNRNIGSGVHYTSIHLHKYYREKYSYKENHYPNAAWISDRTVSLPLSARLSTDDIKDVVDAVYEIIQLYKK